MVYKHENSPNLWEIISEIFNLNVQVSSQKVYYFIFLNKLLCEANKWLSEIYNFTVTRMDLDIFHLQWCCFVVDPDL